MLYNGFYTYYPGASGNTKVQKNAYRGNLNRLRKNISNGINIYIQTNMGITPLFLAISNVKTDAAYILLDIYERDLQFIADSVKCNSKVWRHFPILIGFSENDIRLVQKLYQDYRSIEEDKNDLTKCVVVLLKMDNFTPVQVICFSPQTVRGKQIVLDIINHIIENGQLDLNAHMTQNNSLLYAAVATGSSSIFDLLCDLGAWEDAVELFVASLKYGQMDMLEMIYHRFHVKICDVIENENFSEAVFASNKPECWNFIFEKFIDERHVAWEFIVNMELKPSNLSVFNQAILFNRIEFAEFCLQHKPRLLEPNSEGYLPVHYLNYSDDRAKQFVATMIEMEPKLVEYNVSYKPTILYSMIDKNWIEIVLEYLNKFPCAKNIIYQNTEYIWTLFERTIVAKYYEMAEVLIIHGQDYLKGIYDIIPILDCCIRGNRIDLVKIIFDVFGPVLNAPAINIISISKPIINALAQHRLHIFKFMVGKNNLDLRAVINELGQNLLHFAIWEKLPWYDENMPGSLWDSIYRIPDDTEDEEDQKLGLLPKFQRPDENYPDPYEITDEDRAEKDNFDKLFEELLDLGVDFNQKCSSNNTLLHRAVKVNNLYATKRLLELGVDLNTYNNEGELAIHCATNLQIFQVLNSWTENNFINSKNCVTGKSPLHKSVVLPPSEIELAQYILEQGGDVNASDNEGRTPIFDLYHIEYAELLLTHQANLNIRDKFGNTPIHVAFGHHNPKIINLLFEQPNVDYCAINDKGTSYLEKFVTYRYDREIDKPSQVFQKICTMDNPHFKQLLQTHCNTRIEYFDTTVIGMHEFQNDEILSEMVLVQPHLDINVRCKLTGNTALHMAAEHGNALLFDKLIERGIPIDIVNDNNDTPLNICCLFSGDMVPKIIKHKPDVHIRNKSGNTAIFNAAQTNNGCVCAAILAAGGNIFDQDEERNSAYSLMSDQLKRIFVFLT